MVIKIAVWALREAEWFGRYSMQIRIEIWDRGTEGHEDSGTERQKDTRTAGQRDMRTAGQRDSRMLPAQQGGDKAIPGHGHWSCSGIATTGGTGGTALAKVSPSESPSGLWPPQMCCL